MNKYSLKNFLPPRFPWRQHNHFELLVNGAQYFPAILAAIEQAQHSIKLEMYLASSGQLFTQFVAALTRAAQRGVRVRILLDDFGTQRVNAIDRDALNTQGLELRYYNRLRWRKGLGNLLRNHRKLLVIDRQLVFVGGTGLTDEFVYTTAAGTPWHEVMLAIRGPVVADWCELFERTWSGLHQTPLKALATPIKPETLGVAHGRVCASNGPRAHHVAQSLYRQIAQAQQRVWLMTPYFLPSLKLRHLLIAAAKRNLDTRILVPGQLTDHPAIRHASRRHYARLLKHGVRIFEYQPQFMHAKIALCDSWVSLGSTNFDRWNLHWNLDANQEIDDAAFANQVQALLQHDYTHSEELRYATWLQRPWYSRLQEWFNGKLDQLLSKLR